MEVQSSENGGRDTDNHSISLLLRKSVVAVVDCRRARLSPNLLSFKPCIKTEEIMPNNLCDISVDKTVRIKAIKGEPAVCQRLREMGFCEYAEVRKVSQSGSCICHVCGVKVALSKYLAKNILVETVE